MKPNTPSHPFHVSPGGKPAATSVAGELALYAEDRPREGGSGPWEALRAFLHRRRTRVLARRTAQVLRGLDDRALKDIGVSRCEIDGRSLQVANELESRRGDLYA